MSLPKPFRQLWAIYDHPRDYPDQHFVMRRWVVVNCQDHVALHPTDEVHFADSVEDLRSLVPNFCRCIPNPNPDAPVVVETWL